MAAYPTQAEELYFEGNRHMEAADNSGAEALKEWVEDRSSSREWEFRKIRAPALPAPR